MYFLRLVKIITHRRDDFEMLKLDLMRRMSMEVFAKVLENSLKMKLAIVKEKYLCLDLSVDNVVVKDDVTQGKANAKMTLRVIHYIEDDSMGRYRDIVSPSHSIGALSSHLIRLDVSDASRRLDESNTSRRLDECNAYNVVDFGNVMRCRLSVREENFQSSSLSAFDKNHEEVKDGVVNANGEGAIGCLKDGSSGLFNVIESATQLSVSVNPPKLLSESYSSKRMEESVTSRQTVKSIAPRWLVQILTYFFNCYQKWIPWVYLTRYPGKCFPGDFVLQIMLLFNLSCLGLVLP